MVESLQLIALILGFLFIGAVIGLYLHVFLRRPRQRCPRCGTQNRDRRPELAITCRSCSLEFQAATA